MSTEEIIVLVVIALVLLALIGVGYALAQQRKRKQLQSRFGPEYDRTVESTGRRRDAERELAERAERRRQLDIRPLPEQDRRAFAERWRQTQEDFVDRPSTAVREADRLVAEVMGRRGYPVGDFDQQARDVSVDHAHVVDEYRAAHDISELNDREQATTEQLRQAMVHYRALFTDLLRDEAGAETDRVEREPVHETDRDLRPASDVRYAGDEDRDLRPTSDVAYAGEDRDVRPASDVGYAGDEDSQQHHRVDDPSRGRTVVEGGLVRPAGDGTTDRDAPRDVR